MADLFDRIYLNGQDSIGLDVTVGHELTQSDNYLVHELEVLERRNIIRESFAQAQIAGSGAGTGESAFDSTDVYFLTEHPERLEIQMTLGNPVEDPYNSTALWFLHMGDEINNAGIFKLSTGGFNAF